jgi:hypothetical protein
MKDFLELVMARQSDRAYNNTREVEPDKLERVLEAARLASEKGYSERRNCT